nr:sorting nexin 13 [Hymenolepis microstoma]
MQSEFLGQSNDLTCSVCRNLLHIPYTLPCQHSYCLEPCLQAQRTSENLKCFNCGKCYPFKEAIHNDHLEALVTKRLVEEKRSLITTCDACTKPSLDLRDCKHCGGRVCPTCCQSHYDKVASTVKKLVKVITKAQKNVTNIQSKLVKKSSDLSRLEKSIESASSELKIACDKTLDRANAQLDSLASAYTQKKISARRRDIQSMGMHELLQVRSELKSVTNLVLEFLTAVSDLGDEGNPFGVEMSKSYSSLIYPIQSLSLVEEERDNSISEKNVADSIDDIIDCTPNQIFVGGLIPKISYTQFKSYFSQYGAIKNAFIAPSRRSGYVTFSKKESALLATAQPFQLIENVKVEVRPFLKKSKRPPSKKPATESPSSITHPTIVETDQKRVFVGGILPSTTKDTVQSALLKFGPIKRLDFMPQRGFAIVQFEQPEIFDLALSTHWHEIDGKRVELLQYLPRKSNPPLSANFTDSSDLRTIFIGGLTPKINEESIRSSLSYFGSIEKVLINSLKGYALVTFKSVDAASKAIASHWIIINEKKVEMVAFERNPKRKLATTPPVSYFSSISEIQETNGNQSVEDVSKRKLYVDGIVPPINETMLKTYFSQYGAVIFCQITGQRACLIFESSKGVEAASKAFSHIVVGRNLKIAPCTPICPKPSEINTDASQKDVGARKLIIKGISEDVTYSGLRDYFSNYGPVDCVNVYGTDAWIVFEKAETATLVLTSQPHFIRGRQVSLQRPNSENSPRIRAQVEAPGKDSGSPIIQDMPSLGKLAILTLLSSLFVYGVGIFVYFIYVLLAFAAGFLFFLPEIQWVSLKRKIPISHGLVEIDSKKATTSHLKVNYAISGCHELDVVLNQILDCIINDYIRSWYTLLTNEPKFPQQLHAAMAQLMTEVSKRAQKIDWIPFIIEGIPNIIIEHLRIHRRSLDRQAQSSNSADLSKFFFDEEMEVEVQFCREEVCTSSEKELNHFRRITDVFLFAIMPEEDYRLLTIRYLLKEILVNGVLLPAVNVLSDPDFVNQSIIKLCNESAFASPYFIQSLRMSTVEDELKVVKERIEIFAVKLRGRDSGGDDDTMVKAQLNSLNFLENVCNSQITEIKRGVPQKSEQRMNSSNPGSDGLGRTSIDLTFADVMGNDVAVSNFLEFLTSINEQSLLSLYLNCMAYRVNSEELMSSITSTPSTNEPEGDAFGPNSGWNETKTPELDLTFQQAGESQVRHQISDEDQEAMGRIREFGVSMCSLVMRTLPQIPEEIVKRCLKGLSTPLDTIDPNIFIIVEEELIKMLSSEQCFGAFKRSSYYARVVEAFKSSSSGMFLESSRRLGANGSEDAREAPPYSSQSASSSPVFSRAASAVSVNSSSYSPQGSQTHLNSTSSSVSYFPDSYTVNVLSGEMVREGYVVYTLEVTCLSTITKRRSTWRTHRRYSQFDDLHSLIVEQCGRIPNLKLPAKKSFTSVSIEFIEKRRSELDDYLQILCGIDTTGRYPKLHPILSDFLQPEKWERKKGVSSLMNPFKAVGSAIISVPDTLFDGFSKMINRRPPIDLSDVNSNVSTPLMSSNSTASRSSLVSDTSNLAILDQNDSDNIPFRLLFMLVDEVFSLQGKTQLFRRGTLAILRNIVQTFFGDIMNRRIVEKAKNLISAKQMATYAGILRDVLWPNGSQVQTNGVSKDTTQESYPLRDEAMKLRTRVLCRAVMFGSVAEELASYLGQETTREGVQRVFDLLQQPCLNRRLVHCLLEGVIRLLLADQATRLNEIYAQDYSRHPS